MRGITRDALVRMDLDSESWEYASEMVIKTVHLGLRTSEVPVRFLKDIDGRLSHHKRAGWRSPWSAAWINLRSMFVYGSDFFLLKPGLALFLLGLVCTLPLSGGPIAIGHVTLLAVLDARRRHGGGRRSAVVLPRRRRAGPVRLPGPCASPLAALFPYTRSVVVAAVIVAVGFACAVPLLVYYIGHHERLSLAAQTQDGLAVTGLLLTVIGASLFTFTLVLHAAVIATRRSSARFQRAS